MNLHEHQAKRLFAQVGIPVPEGGVASSVQQARAIAARLGGERWVVKAQIHAGGRGKAGGVRRARGVEELERVVAELLGRRLVTHQTPPEGLPVEQVLIEPHTKVERELYLGAVVERARARVTFMVSAAGGVDIEEVAAREPGRILTAVVDPVAGLMPYQWRRIGFALGLPRERFEDLGRVMAGLYRLFQEQDAALAEINPLALTADGRLLALDAKIVLDDNALFRHPELARLEDPAQEDPREREARRHGLSYIPLDGDIGCMVNGAGLAMATMDLIQLHGGRPANFLDVGGTATAERVAEAFKLILAEARVRAVLVNIFGGIVRCDLIAEGIVRAVRQVGIRVPVVVRLEGTRVEEGRAILRESALPIESAEGLTDAARRAVAAARRGEG